MSLLSQYNQYYKFSKIDGELNVEKYKDKITTFYVVEGRLLFDIDGQKIIINSTEGLLNSSNSKINNLDVHHRNINNLYIHHRKNSVRPLHSSFS